MLWTLVVWKMFLSIYKLYGPLLYSSSSVTFSKFLKITRFVVCLEDRSSVHCLFLDFAKAFDSVLLKRLTYLVSLSGFVLS